MLAFFYRCVLVPMVGPDTRASSRLKKGFKIVDATTYKVAPKSVTTPRRSKLYMFSPNAPPLAGSLADDAKKTPPSQDLRLQDQVAKDLPVLLVKNLPAVDPLYYGPRARPLERTAKPQPVNVQRWRLHYL